MTNQKIKQHPCFITAVVVTAWQGQIRLIQQGTPFSTSMCPQCAIDEAIKSLKDEMPEDFKGMLDSFSELHDHILNQI